MKGSSEVRIGTAGWSIPRAVAEAFPAEGSALERYAAVFDAVEINSTFYRPHRASTFLRWAGLTPVGFRFSVKVPRAITHDARLVDGGAAVARFLDELEPLRAKLGVLLVQLPPSLAFDPAVADVFFAGIRKVDPAIGVACEPRHASWFTAAADDLLAGRQISRVAADPARSPGAGEPGGWPGLSYHRLHGAPRMYFSAYDAAAVAALAARLQAGATPAWCVFDNTASGAAAADALALQRLVAGGAETPQLAPERQLRTRVRPISSGGAP